jgi:IS1 family transposase
MQDDQRPVRWDSNNRRHIFWDHKERNLTKAEVEEVMADSYRVTEWSDRRKSYSTLGRSDAGRWLFIAWVDHLGGRYPIHVRQAGRKLVREMLGRDQEENDG